MCNLPNLITTQRSANYGLKSEYFFIFGSEYVHTCPYQTSPFRKENWKSQLNYNGGSTVSFKLNTNLTLFLPYLLCHKFKNGLKTKNETRFNLVFNLEIRLFHVRVKTCDVLRTYLGLNVLDRLSNKNVRFEIARDNGLLRKNAA